MAVANAAPITAMTGNVPIALGYGNGIGAPAGYLVATVVLTLFTIGFVSMARYITTAGAFYGFITHGLGQVWGMASGVLATMAYVVFEGSLVGIFAFFTHDALDRWVGIDANWLVIAIVGIVVIGLFGYFDINIAAAFLGVTLVAEVILLGALAFSVLFSGGGPDGLRGLRRSTRSTRSSRWRRAAASGCRSTARPSPPAAPRSGCSSRSGPGSATRPPRCTARSPATRSGSCRWRPCWPWSASAPSTPSSPG